MQQSIVTTATGKLAYTIAHRPRVTRRLHLEVDEGGGLVIVAPKHWSRAHIHATLSQNTGRVVRFLATARQRLVPPLQYVQGEQHLFMGAAYSLVLVTAASGRRRNTPRVVISGQELQVNTARPGAHAVKPALTAWYRQQARNIFNERLQMMATKAPWTAGRALSLQLRSMRRTWGNCSAKGVIKLNTHLIKTPLPMLDAVIAHELCHLQEMNHSRAFYVLLESLNPNWRQDRAMLRSQGYLYLRT